MQENSNLVKDTAPKQYETRSLIFGALEYGIRTVQKSECRRKTPTLASSPPARIPFTSNLEQWAQNIQEPPRFMVITLEEMEYLDFLTSQMIEGVLQMVQTILQQKSCAVVFINMPNKLQNRFEQGQDWFSTEDECLKALNSIAEELQQEAAKKGAEA